MGLLRRERLPCTLEREHHLPWVAWETLDFVRRLPLRVTATSDLLKMVTHHLIDRLLTDNEKAIVPLIAGIRKDIEQA